MSEAADREDRTEAPSPKRLREARERGDVPRSRELANVAERRVLGLGEPQWDDPDIGQSLVAQQEAFEAQCLRAALSRHKGDIKAVMAELQLPRRTFNEKMQRHGLVREMFV